MGFGKDDPTLINDEDLHLLGVLPPKVKSWILPFGAFTSFWNYLPPTKGEEPGNVLVSLGISNPKGNQGKGRIKKKLI